MAANGQSYDVAVFGSFIIDMTIYCARPPLPGESLVGHAFELGFGGKGANQAAMAHNLGVKTIMAGCLGDDTFGKDYRRHLEAEGIPVALKPVSDVSTGAAQITVTSDGQNYIVVVAGANSLITREDVESPSTEIGIAVVSARILVCELEVPLAATEAALKKAKAAGVMTVLNTAPIPNSEQEKRAVAALFPLADIVCANEVEAAALCGVSGEDGNPGVWLSAMKAAGCRQPLVTLGAGGAALFDDAGHVRILTAPCVTAVDTTGAGDAFIGCLAALLAEGRSLIDATAAAVRVASQSVTKRGTQKSYPRGDEARALVKA